MSKEDNIKEFPTSNDMLIRSVVEAMKGYFEKSLPTFNPQAEEKRVWDTIVTSYGADINESIEKANQVILARRKLFGK